MIQVVSYGPIVWWEMSVHLTSDKIWCTALIKNKGYNWLICTKYLDCIRDWFEMFYAANSEIKFMVQKMMWDLWALFISCSDPLFQRCGDEGKMVHKWAPFVNQCEMLGPPNREMLKWSTKRGWIRFRRRILREIFIWLFKAIVSWFCHSTNISEIKVTLFFSIQLLFH